MSSKRIKALYVCPFAHYSGHPPWAAIHEPAALARAGADVTLLTFYGIIDDTKVKVPQVTVIPRAGAMLSVQRVINFLFTRWSILRWPVMLLENLWTVGAAVRMTRKSQFDIVHLRDGDPFLFIPFLLSSHLKDSRWVISLMGGNFFYKPPPLSRTVRKDFRLFVYGTALKILNSGLWKGLYRRSLVRNHFHFLTQSEAIKRDYSSYLGGIFSGKITCLPLGFGSDSRPISKKEARKRLGLPQDKTVFLSFGVPHPGKDLEAVFRALKDVPGVFLVQAGKSAFSVGHNPTKLAQDYAVTDRVVINDNYISEEEKPLYFLAADAVVLSYTKQFLSTASLLWEACIFGIPVIASNQGQLGELVRAFQVGLLFEAQDATSLREAMIDFTHLGRDEIESLKKNCQKFSGEFSIDKWARKCLEVYEGLLS